MCNHHQLLRISSTELTYFYSDLPVASALFPRVCLHILPRWQCCLDLFTCWVEVRYGSSNRPIIAPQSWPTKQNIKPMNSNGPINNIWTLFDFSRKHVSSKQTLTKSLNSILIIPLLETRTSMQGYFMLLRYCNILLLLKRSCKIWHPLMTTINVSDTHMHENISFKCNNGHLFGFHIQDRRINENKYNWQLQPRIICQQFIRITLVRMTTRGSLNNMDSSTYCDRKPEVTHAYSAQFASHQNW